MHVELASKVVMPGNFVEYKVKGVHISLSKKPMVIRR